MLSKANEPIDAFSGKIPVKLEGNLAKYRKRGERRQVVFAFTRKSADCDSWVVIAPGQWWSLMSDVDFADTYTPSNQEAREASRNIRKIRDNYRKAMEGAK